MAQSPEYPDLKWMPPKSWTAGRKPGCPRVVVIHDTEGSSHSQSAEDGASYDQRRTDGTSAHYFHDSDSSVQCVRTTDEAHTARAHGNDIGIQHELCAKASFTKAQWLSASYGRPMLQRTARQVARDCRKWDIPVRRITAAQVRSGAKGICGHADITAAFPEDNGTHTDPGPNFPWTEFLDMVRAELNGEDDVALTPAQDGALQRINDIYNGKSPAQAKLDLTLTAILAAAHADDEAGIRAHIDAKVAELAKAQTATRDAILTALPAGSDPVSREELEAALRTVLGSLDATPAPQV